MTTPRVPHMSAHPDSLSEVTLIYNDVPVSAAVGSRLLDALLNAGHDHRHVCGGMGFCTSCRVEVISGADHLSPVSSVERERLGSEAGRLRLACQTQVLGTVTIKVPRPVSQFSPDGD